MSDISKKIIAVAAVACMAFSTVTSCSDKNAGKGDSSSKSSSSEDADVFDNSIDSVKNEDDNIVAMPFQTGKSGEGGFTAPDAEDLEADDPVSGNSTADPNAESSTEVEVVTDSQGEPVTEIVTVTDASGETVTDAAGEPATETVTVTKASSGSSEKTTSVSAEDYVSSTDSMYCLWMDISKDENFVFNDEFIKITFKLKEDIPDRDYPVRFSPDLSSIAGVSIHPDKVYQGTIRVGGDIEAQDVSSETGFVAYGDNISANQGDTVDYYINFKNNPGLAAFLVWFYYDSNAMEVVKVSSAGEFAEISNKTQTGTSPANS